MESKHDGGEKSAAVTSHRHDSPKKLKIALFTVSSSRYRDPNLDDDSGEIAKDLCQKAGHAFSHQIIDDSKPMVRLSLFKSLYENDCDATIFLGGTGLSPRDVTIEAVLPLIDKRLDGFGEIFRQLSYDSIGSAALMTRAIAGTIDSKLVYCLPGSPDAAKVGMDLVLKELPHAVFISKSKP
ncbi:MAG: MogA/MoaB family molybdenum cofactor biosynthesis protein [Thaumarchaeota archaeon]|nr:MogA/MoaB family molybdenum cofactor biosynthesis protein [Nitrososphaerota archaeon]